MKQLFFCDVNDGSSHNNLQVIISKERRKEMPALGFGASVVTSGKINVAPKGNLELLADDFQMIGMFVTFSLGPVNNGDDSDWIDF